MTSTKRLCRFLTYRETEKAMVLLKPLAAKSALFACEVDDICGSISRRPTNAAHYASDVLCLHLFETGLLFDARNILQFTTVLCRPKESGVLVRRYCVAHVYDETPEQSEFLDYEFKSTRRRKQMSPAAPLSPEERMKQEKNYPLFKAIHRYAARLL